MRLTPSAAILPPKWITIYMVDFLIDVSVKVRADKTDDTDKEWILKNIEFVLKKII